MMNRFFRLFLLSFIFLSGCSVEGTAVRFTKEQMKRIPLSGAVRTVSGDGSGFLAVVSLINCPHCRTMHDVTSRLENATVYTFVLDGGTETTARQVADVYCSTNPDETLARVFNDPGRHKPENTQGCAALVRAGRAAAFFREQRISAFPALINRYGDILYGTRSAEETRRFMDVPPPPDWIHGKGNENKK